MLICQVKMWFKTGYDKIGFNRKNLSIGCSFDAVYIKKE